MNIGIIGCGAITRFLLQKINKEKAINCNVKSIFVRDEEKYKKISELYDVNLFTDFNVFLQSNIDVVVEAAHISAVKQLIPKAIQVKDVIIVSIGAFADQQFLQTIIDNAKAYRNTVHLPSGAIGGLDLLQNAQTLNGITDVIITTRKPAHTLTDETLQDEKIVFHGPAVEAIKMFPENINVSIVLSLAGIGVNRTTVKIIADPNVQNNNHSIYMKGAFGEATVNVENNPLLENPKTSYLAALSILGTLNKMDNIIKIG